jgi:hypothetical protein
MTKNTKTPLLIALALATGLVLATPAIADPDSTRAVKWTYQPGTTEQIKWTYQPGSSREVEQAYRPDTRPQNTHQYKPGYSSPGDIKGFNPQPEPPRPGAFGHQNSSHSNTR